MIALLYQKHCYLHPIKDRVRLFGLVTKKFLVTKSKLYGFNDSKTNFSAKHIQTEKNVHTYLQK